MGSLANLLQSQNGGAAATAQPATGIQKAPIPYDRMRAIMNSGVLKNPNASMAPPVQETPPVQQPQAPVQQQPNPFESFLAQLRGNPALSHLFNPSDDRSN